MAKLAEKRLKMAGNGCTWLYMPGNVWKWLEMARIVREMAGIGWTWPKMAGHCWNCLGNGCIWWEMAGNA